MVHPTYLQDIPAGTIKIDQSYIRRLVPGSRGSALVRNMITMARELGFRVVAEGVEMKEVYDFSLRHTVRRGAGVSDLASAAAG